MSDEGDLDKRKVNIRVQIETCKKVVARFGMEGDNGDAPAFVRALEDATRGVTLSPEDYDAIAAEVRRNFNKRMQKRKNRK